MSNERVVKHRLSQFAPKPKDDERVLTAKKISNVITGDNGDNMIMVLLLRADISVYHKFNKVFQKVAEAAEEGRKECPEAEVIFKTFVPGHTVEVEDNIVKAPEAKK